MWLFVYSFG